MKLLSLILFIALTISLYAQEDKPENVALILIDIQNFYFEGGSSELVNPEKASENAAKILTDFREKKNLVIHVRHNVGSGGDIHANVKPIEGEKVFSKDEVNAFNGTKLKAYLDEKKINKLILVGMQTHMCLEGTTRAAYDFGYECIVISDACATKDLDYNERIINAEDVHYSTLKTLESYAKVITTEELLSMENP
jgi:nicotinamidase-related amidase